MYFISCKSIILQQQTYYTYITQMICWLLRLGTIFLLQIFKQFSIKLKWNQNEQIKGNSKVESLYLIFQQCENTDLINILMV